MAIKRESTKKRDPNQMTVGQKPGEDHAAAIARTVIRPTVQAAVTLKQYGKSSYDDLDLSGLIDSLTEQTRASSDGDPKRAESMLVVQAHVLDSIFNVLARRAALNMGEYLGACDTYLKLALRAQSQCRATWEALATIKNPPIVGYIRQANLAAGPQQVNNGPAPAEAASRAREKQNRPNKLLEKIDAERLDTRAAGSPGRAYSDMATVGGVDGSKKRGG